jgi:hypothetical protein
VRTWFLAPDLPPIHDCAVKIRHCAPFNGLSDAVLPSTGACGGAVWLNIAPFALIVSVDHLQNAPEQLTIPWPPRPRHLEGHVAPIGDKLRADLDERTNLHVIWGMRVYSPGSGRMLEGGFEVVRAG